MPPINETERSKKLVRFALFYGLSAAALCVIVFAFTSGGSESESAPPAGGSPGFSHSVFSADSMLHRDWMELENTDTRYASALALTKTREGMRTADSLRRKLPLAEQDFQFTLDSISRVSRTGANAPLQQTVNFFAASLELRNKRLASGNVKPLAVPTADPSLTGMSVDNLIRNNPELKGEMLKRDVRIADLESTIVQLKKEAGAAGKAPEKATAGPAAPQLQQDYDALQKKYNILAEANAKLRNNPPATTASPEDSEPVKAARARVAKLEQQVRGMNADLSFSAADCNISRADINQIISSGRQRKVLLQQAMSILLALQKSDDEQVQKRAAQKISELNKVAMTVRD